MEAAHKKFGRYELVRTLGVGGMAQTFVALRYYRIGTEEVWRQVCLKQVLPIYNSDEDFLHLFHREAKLAIQLQHPNIVKVQDFGEVDDVHFMELELVNGVDLLSLLQSQGGRLPADVIKLLALDIAAALHCAHNHVDQETGERGIIHRDVSPSNILISERGDIKLTDFGIAKALSGSATAKASRAPLGKLPYMAPERFNRKLPTDGRADLFSLGIVMFECAGGLRPYDGEDDSETIGNIIAGAPRSLSQEAPDLEEPLSAIIEGLISPNLDARIQDAAELTDRLHDIAPSLRARGALAKMVQKAMAERGPVGEKPTSGTAELPKTPAPDEQRSGIQGSSRGTAGLPSSKRSAPRSKPESQDDLRTPPIELKKKIPPPRPDRAAPPVPNPWRRRLMFGLPALLVVGALASVVIPLCTKRVDPPLVTNPGDQTSREGDKVRLQIEASDPKAESIRFRAANLPPGLSITRRGQIRGTLAADSAGVYDVTVTVRGVESTSIAWVWSVESSKVEPPPPPPGEPDPPSPDPPTPDAPTPDPPVGGDPPKPPEAPDAPVVTHGWVKVVVIPFGNAWIDGKPYRPSGNGFMRVRAGSHVVRAGQGGLATATEKRTIRVRPGKKSRVEMDLMD